VNILGISCNYHDAAAALVRDGVLVAAVQEERFSRVKHDPSFPARSIRWCLEAGKVAPDGIDAVVYYEKPLTKFGRVLRTSVQAGPRGFGSFLELLPRWATQQLWVGYQLEKGITRLGWRMPKDVWFAEHHESHAASAFFPSPFERAAIMTFDGVGEWATASIGLGRGNQISLERRLNFPDSLGLLYSTFTAYCGFRVNSDEYKLMGLAPYGEPTYVDAILDELLELRDDGSFTMDQRYFAYVAGRRMYSDRFERLFGGPARAADAPITRREMDLARSVQVVTEEVVLRMARTAHELTGERQACLSGGVALNCVANARLLRDGPFDEVWVQPASGDAGSAVGAALWGWHQVAGNPRRIDRGRDGMHGSLLGPAFEADDVHRWLDDAGYPYERMAGADRSDRIAELLADGQVVGLLQGRMEFGPRALGNRSILADARDPEVQSRLNLRTKSRESFRPFAPAVLAEKAAEWFDLDSESPYMLLTAQVAAAHRRGDDAEHPEDPFEWVRQVRSDVPAVTHVDGSARVQTVDADRNPALHAILTAFEARTGVPMVVNTSFNVADEPIVCTPADAYRTFLASDLDVLVIEDALLRRADQPDAPADGVEAHPWPLDGDGGRGGGVGDAGPGAVAADAARAARDERSRAGAMLPHY
jgi:carbamoyltransferase